METLKAERSRFIEGFPRVVGFTTGHEYALRGRILIHFDEFRRALRPQASLDPETRATLRATANRSGTIVAETLKQLSRHTPDDAVREHVGYMGERFERMLASFQRRWSEAPQEG